MQQTEMPYTLETENIGYLVKESLNLVRMPRSRFLEIVEETVADTILDEFQVAALKEIMPVARKMERFPFDTWVDTDRGCGCVIGEYLIAAQDIVAYNKQPSVRKARATVAELLSHRSVSDLLSERVGPDLANQLYNYGGAIDTALRREIEGRVNDPEGITAEQGFEFASQAVNTIVITDNEEN